MATIAMLWKPFFPFEKKTAGTVSIEKNLGMFFVNAILRNDPLPSYICP